MKKRNSIRLPLAVALSCVLAPGWARADAEAEREALARLANEIQALEALIEEAEAQGGDTRVRFQYGWLRQDLAQVVTGITEHLEAPLGAPRQFPPLKGDYRR